MTKILYLDAVCPAPYDPLVLASSPLGGTEATVIRVAERLACMPLMQVHVAQHNRTERVNHKAIYLPLKDVDYTAYDHIVVLREAKNLREIKAKAPKATVHLWCHDLFGPWLSDYVGQCADTEAPLIVVSEFHRRDLINCLTRLKIFGKIKATKVIPNPIDDNLRPNGVAYDRNKLIWLSSPHKGLKNALDIFQFIRQTEPAMTLHVANPGYIKGVDLSSYENVVDLGALPHSKAIEQTRTALAAFHINTIFPETFGLVNAEANAVGTPFLAHRGFGANEEIIDHPLEVTNCNDAELIRARILFWRDGFRPNVRGSPYFRTKQVASMWYNYFVLGG